MTQDCCPVTMVQKTDAGYRWCECSEPGTEHDIHRFLQEDWKGPDAMVPFQAGRILIDDEAGYRALHIEQGLVMSDER